MLLKKMCNAGMGLCLVLSLAACGGESSTPATGGQENHVVDRKLQYRAEQLGDLKEDELAERTKQLEAVKEQLKAKRDEIVKQGGKWLDSKLTVLEHQDAFQSEAMKNYLATLLDIYLPLAEGTVDVVPVTAAYQEDGSLLAVMMLRNGKPDTVLTSAELASVKLTIQQGDGQKVVEVPFAPAAEDVGQLQTGEARPIHIVIDKKDVWISDYPFQQEGYVFSLQGL